MISKRKNSFDERQLAARGIAFKYGFFAFVIVILLFAFVKDMFSINCDPLGEALLILSIPYAITMSIFIVKDAYDPINSKPGIIIFSIMACCAIVFTALHIKEKDILIYDHYVTSEFGLISFYVSWIVIALIYWIKNIKERKEESK